MKKIAIIGASHFVNRMFEACGNYQWAREFSKTHTKPARRKSSSALSGRPLRSSAYIAAPSVITARV